MSEKESSETQEQLSEQQQTEGQEPVTDTTEAQTDSVETLNEKLKEAEAKMLRLAADFENDRKRIQKRSEDMLKFANEKIVVELLAVMDDFERAFDSVEQGHDIETIKQGLEMVQSNLKKVLSEHGVEMIEALDKPFDPNLHEAVTQEVDENKEDGTVLEVIQNGYTLNGRLARPSRVKISKSA